MSFKLFVYYCALCGGWAALVGWGLGQWFAPKDPDAVFARTILRGFLLGTTVALALGLLDAVWNLSARQGVQIAFRAMTAMLVGCAGSLIGAAVGQALFSLTGWPAFVIVGWALTGLLIGASVGMYDVFARLARGEELAGAWKKVMNGLLGGALGGVLGSAIYLLLGADWGLAQLLNKPAEQLKINSAVGFVALGLFIGLFIGLAQIMLKEAWLTVESGFRAGREMILSKAETVIGRAEGSDIGLFGDQTVERTHARIVVRENRYYLADAGGGTFLNDQRITQPALLRTGDVIRIGQSRLRFGERQKKPV